MFGFGTRTGTEQEEAGQRQRPEMRQREERSEEEEEEEEVEEGEEEEEEEEEGFVRVKRGVQGGAEEVMTEGARRFPGRGVNVGGDKRPDASPSLALDLRTLAGPLTTTFSVGTLTGACAASAVKKVGRMSAGFIGASFLGLQLLAYKGYITVHWDKIEHDAKAIFDRDGDGEVSQADLQYWQDKLSQIATFQLPASMTGFGVGFGLGIRYL